MNKKATLACLTIAMAVCINAQAQNHFPSSGNVGIGITTPIYLLDIRSTSSNNLHVSGTGNDDGAYFGTNFSGGFWVGNAMFNGTNWVAKANTSGIMDTYLGDFLFYSNTGLTVGSTFTPITLMKLTNTGNLGIGTTSPLNRLDIFGSMALGSYAGTVTAPANSLILSGNLGIGTTTPAQALDVAGNIKVSQAATLGGNISVGGTASITGATTLGGSLTLPGTISASGSNSLVLQTNNTAVVTVLSNGNVGIGTSSPGQSLDVTGNTHVSGNQTIDGNTTVGGALNITGAFNTAGNLTASCVSAACLNVSGTFATVNISASSTITSDTVRSGIIASPDSLIHFGTHSGVFDTKNMTLYNDAVGTNTNLASPNGIAIGQYASAWSNNSIVLGGGYFNGSQTIGPGLSNGSPLSVVGAPSTPAIPNSLMVGFNSNLPTLFVGPAIGIGTTGNVGIGTYNPIAPLQVNGSISIYAKNNNGIFNGDVSLLFGQETAPSGPGKWGIQYEPAGGGNQGGLNFWIPFDGADGNNFGNNYLFISDGVLKNNVNMPNGSGGLTPTTVTTNGYIGIGTSNPSYKLDVNGVVNASGYLINGTLFTGSGGGQWNNSTFNSGDIYYNSGRVMIGVPTTQFSTLPYSGGYNLYVTGGILTELLAVATNSPWADFVFKKDYKLESIEDLDAFITKNHHLPNIPTSEDVKKEGIDVAKMDSKLLEKIEELTLYVIELKKEIKDLESQKNK